MYNYKCTNEGHCPLKGSENDRGEYCCYYDEECEYKYQIIEETGSDLDIGNQETSEGGQEVFDVKAINALVCNLNILLNIVGPNIIKAYIEAEKFEKEMSHCVSDKKQSVEFDGTEFGGFRPSV